MNASGSVSSALVTAYAGGHLLKSGVKSNDFPSDLLRTPDKLIGKQSRCAVFMRTACYNSYFHSYLLCRF